MPVYRDKQRDTWYVSYSFKDLPTGSFKHKTKRGFKTAKAAKEWERQAYGQNQVSRPKTFEDVVTEWETNNQASQESRRHYTEHIKFRTGSINQKRIDDISVQDLILWRNALISMDYSTKTKNDTITFVRGVLAFAAMLYGVPNSGVALKRIKKTDEEIMAEMNIWSPAEFNQFIAYVEEPVYRTYFKFLFWTGCRRGEALALQKPDVHDSKVYIHYSQRTKKVGLKPTKTKQNRWITLDNSLAADISELLKHDTECTYVFSLNGGSLSPTQIDETFKKAIKDSGVKKIRIHDLRHSHASWLINNGVNIVAVSKRLGHATIDQTLKTYTHLIQQSDDKMMEFINQSVRQI